MEASGEVEVCWSFPDWQVGRRAETCMIDFIRFTSLTLTTPDCGDISTVCCYCAGDHLCC